MSDTRVLEDIFKTLKSLETRLDGQNNRLGAIEVSVRSAGASSVSGGSYASTPVRDSVLSDKPDDSTSPITPVSLHASPASLYKASILELRNRFEFVDSCSDIGTTPAAGCRRHQFSDESEFANGSMRHTQEVAYTESVYSRPLSRLDLGGLSEMTTAPVVAGEREPALSATKANGSYQANENIQGLRYEETLEDGLAYYGQPDEKAQTERLADNEFPRRPHQRIEMFYYAWGQFRTSLCHSWWLSSSERRQFKEESGRLAQLSSLTAASKQRGASLGFKGLIMRSMNGMAPWRTRTVTVA